MRVNYSYIFWINAALIISCCYKPVYAASDCDKTSEEKTPKECAAVGEWAFGIAAGIGVRTNPLVDSDNIPLVLLPSISYYGENFFIDNLDIGYTFYENDAWSSSLLVTPSYDRVFFERWDLGNIFVDISSGLTDSPSNLPTPPTLEGETPRISPRNINKRKTSLMAGVEFSRTINSGLLQFNYLHELTNNHNGQEVRLAFAHPLNQYGWSSTVGLTWKDAAMTDYYYGIDSNEVSDSRSVYNPSASINPFLRLSWKQQSESFWRFGLEYQKLSDEIYHSPIVNKDYVLTAFIGKQFSF